MDRENTIYEWSLSYRTIKLTKDRPETKENTIYERSHKISIENTREFFFESMEFYSVNKELKIRQNMKKHGVSQPYLEQEKICHVWTSES